MVLRVRPPLVPRIVSVNVPFFVVDVVATDNVDDDEDGTSTVPGLNVPVEFAGSPLTLRSTVPLKPLLGVIATVYVAVFPRTTVTLGGDAPMAKSGGGGVAVM